MRTIKSLLIMTITGLFIVSCKPAEQKTMTLEDYLKIETKVLDSDRTPETIESIVKKYGFSLEEYTDFEKRIENDSELQKKAGEIKLNIHPKENK